MTKTLFWTKWFSLVNIFRKTYTANVCGHKTKRTGETVSFDEHYVIRMPLAKNKHPDYCLACIGKMAIRCGWCGRSIIIGDLVTLYSPRPTMPEYTVYHQDEPGNPKSPRTVVGCQRSDCAETGADYHGRWLPPGKVERFPSVIERMMMASEAGDSCPVIIANF